MQVGSVPSLENSYSPFKTLPGHPYPDHLAEFITILVTTWSPTSYICWPVPTPEPLAQKLGFLTLNPDVLKCLAQTKD